MGLADFASSNSNGWPTGPVSIKKSKLGEFYSHIKLKNVSCEYDRIIRNRQPVSCNSRRFDKKNENGPVGHPLELRACKIGQSHYL